MNELRRVKLLGRDHPICEYFRVYVKVYKCFATYFLCNGLGSHENVKRKIMERTPRCVNRGGEERELAESSDISSYFTQKFPDET